MLNLLSLKKFSNPSGSLHERLNRFIFALFDKRNTSYLQRYSRVVCSKNIVSKRVRKIVNVSYKEVNIFPHNAQRKGE